jgi:hypothetical protein
LSKAEADAQQDASNTYKAEQEAAQGTKRQLKKTQRLLDKSAMRKTLCVKGGIRSSRKKQRAAKCKAIDKCRVERERKKLAYDFQTCTQIQSKGRKKGSRSSSKTTAGIAAQNAAEPE